MLNVLDLLSSRYSPRKVASTKGGEYHSACPGCGDGGKGSKSDRFHVWPQENNGAGAYWCRQCRKSGDAIQFLRDFEGLSFHEACRRLDRPIPGHTPYRGPAMPVQKAPITWCPDLPAPPPSRPWREKAGKLAQWACDNLLRWHDPPIPGAAECKQWLASRGIGEFAIKAYRLGWNPGQDGKDIFRPRQSWGLSPELKDDGREKRLWIPRGLVIPLRCDDDIVRIRIRRPEGEPRYYILPGSDTKCMLKMPNHRALIVVESELDGILLDEECIDLVGIVSLGNSSRKPDQAAWQALKNVAVVLVALDYDEAGNKAVDWWLSQLPDTAKHWPVPRGKDIADAYQAGVDLREWVKAGLPEAWFI